MIELTMGPSGNRLIAAASVERVVLEGEGVRVDVPYRAVRYAEAPDTTFLRAVDDEELAAQMPVAGRVRVGDRVAVDRSPYVVRLLDPLNNLVAILEALPTE